jgi:hypothetical protein
VGKRSRQRERSDKLAAPTTEYADDEGNVLTLRGSLTPATRREYAELRPQVREDLWQRQVEFLFERLAVAWTVSGVEWTKQKELLQRFRVASESERTSVRTALRAHLAESFPDLEAP